MRKGLLSPYQEGGLAALTDILQKVEQFTGEAGCDIEGLFYATAFQAGHDHFILHARSDGNWSRPTSEFLLKRTSMIDATRWDGHWAEVQNAFSAYLPEEWHRNDKYVKVRKWRAFIVELLDAMNERACLLAVNGVPDVAGLEELIPAELLVPLENLMQAFEPIGAPSTAPSLAVSRDQIERYQQILSGDLFASYVRSEEGLDDGAAPALAVLDDVRARAQALVRRNPRLLSLRSIDIGLLNYTPKLIDVVFGTLPGVIAEVATKLAGLYLEDRRRVVVYNFRNILHDTATANVVRMIQASNRGAQKAEEKS
jgi:hypothetical protein